MLHLRFSHLGTRLRERIDAASSFCGCCSVRRVVVCWQPKSTMSTEKTPLTLAGPSFGSSTTAPFYVQDTHRFYSRRRRERQLQCIIATFILALIVTISYSVNHPDLLPPTTNVSSRQEASGPLQATGTPEAAELSAQELAEALRAGNEALAARRLADAAARPLQAPSAVWRHQFAVSTSARANELALAATAELAATRRVEQARSFMGRASSFGSRLDGGWADAPGGPCAGRPDADCPAVAPKYRRFDGSCNRPGRLGAAFSPYRRALPPDYADGIGAPRVAKLGGALPSAREVSLKVHSPSPSSNPSFTVMLAVFGQFLDHDITATAVSRGADGGSLACCPDADADAGAPVSPHPECFPVRVGPGDPVYDLAGSSCMEFVRSAPAAQCRIGPRQQLNQVTAFIDGSMIYGSDADTAQALRELAGGRLRMQLTPDNRTLLPASTAPEDGCDRQQELARGRYCFASGDARANENLHLTSMHLLWARQHNLLARRLAEANPHWDDERLYQEARRVVGAQLQHVAYAEFLPVVLGAAEMGRRGLAPLAAGFRAPPATPPDPSVANHFAAAAFRFAHTLLPGLMRVTDRRSAGAAYVQLHKMLFNPYSLYSPGGLESSIASATSNAIQRTSTHVSAQLTQHLFEDPLANGTTAGLPCGLDLVSLNIQRGRDHGLPGYAAWRQFCQLGRPASFDELAAEMDPAALAAISELYDSVDDVDLYTGALAELPRGDGLLGPTFGCLIADQFQRLQSGDRYWYESAEQPGAFTEEQLREIRKTSLARVICDTSDGITEVQPWVMRSVGPDNPMVSCEDLGQPSLRAWRADATVLALSDATVPAFDWLKFKTDVNRTIADIVANIAAKKPPVGSLPADWLAFQTNVNATFSALRDKFSALHPKVATNVSLPSSAPAAQAAPPAGVFDWMGLKDAVSRTVSEVMDSIIANKPAPASLPADWLAYRKKINDSLLDVKKKFKVIHPKPRLAKSGAGNAEVFGQVPAIDWIAIRNEINATITDVVRSINSSRPPAGSKPADWLAFGAKVNHSLIEIKDMFAGLHPKPLGPALKLDKAGDEPTFDWVRFTAQLNASLSELVASTLAKRPPPGSTAADWLQFQKQLNDSFSQFVDQFAALRESIGPAAEPSDAPAKNADRPAPLANQTDDQVDKTIAQIVAEINANRPAPGSPQQDWLAFQRKMGDAFAGMQSKYASSYPKNKSKSKPKLMKAADTGAFDAMASNDDLNNSLASLVDLIKAKKPPVNSSAADWLAYKKEVKASVSKLKKDISAFKTKDMAESDNQEFAAEDASLFDWLGWKNQINNTIDRLLADIQTIPPADPKWASFRDYLNSAFGSLKNNFAGIHAVPTQVNLVAIMKEDLLSFRDQVNSTIEDAIDDIESNQSIPGDPASKKQAKKNKTKISVKNSLAEMQENLKAVTAEWLGKVKAATDVMTVADTRLSAAVGSAATLDMTFIKFNFCATIAVFFMRAAF
ncbi:uncharacterized protein LOC131675405 isoform X2 [Phymastichus coffea]|uniref:uncharacterized protein LOC131675405 isoform X2 n=1 Tax=Phymastichus coffea TaxID=108790 RepID=UPI00273AC68A|nr:uncharacterized protein LOC131675405 isoform X2 [Phymastichus coffea]